jgi:hypothetical protein
MGLTTKHDFFKVETKLDILVQFVQKIHQGKRKKNRKIKQKERKKKGKR